MAPQHMKKLSIIGGFFMELYSTIVSFLTGLVNVVVGLFKGLFNTVKDTVNAVAKKTKVSLQATLTVAMIAMVYLSMGHVFSIPLKAKTVIGAPQSFVGRTWVSTTLLTYTVHNKGIVKTATSPFSSEVYVQIPLVGWLKV